MHDIPILNMVRAVKPLTPTDSIGRAAEALRVSGLGELPVVVEGGVVGVVSEAAVLSALLDGDPVKAAEQPVSTVMSRKVLCVNRLASVSQFAGLLKQQSLRAAPVIDDHGSYLGMATRADISSALCQTIRPQTVAGMATPLGVYLTTGQVRAGAGNLGLFLAGASLMLLTYISLGVVSGIEWIVQKTLPHSWALISAGLAQGSLWANVLRGISAGATVPMFLLLLRFAPLSGYHAAEHQVVHAIENGEPLVPERVRLMPRVHPRCGTNIVVAATLFLVVADAFSNDIATMLAIFILVFAWRIVGGYFQYYITTKPPNEKQLCNGICAGSELLEKFRRCPAQYVTGWRRIWNTGMPQVMMGVATIEAVSQLLHLAFPALF